MRKMKIKKLASLILSGLIVASFSAVFQNKNAFAETEQVFTPIYSWNFDTEGNTEGWIAQNHITGFTASGGYAIGAINGNDSTLLSNDNLGYDISEAKFIKIKMKNNSSATTSAIFFVTNANPSFGAPGHSKNFTITSNDETHTEYILDLSENTEWTGVLRRFRLDPMNNSNVSQGDFSIDYIQIGKYTDKQEEPEEPELVFKKVVSYDFNIAENSEGWSARNGIIDFSVADGFAKGTINNKDPYLWSAANLGINTDNLTTMAIRMKNSSDSTKASLFFVTSEKMTWGAKIGFDLVKNDPEYTEYVLDLSAHPDWKGILYQLRLDPMDDGVSSGSFSIDYIRFGYYGLGGKEAEKDVVYYISSSAGNDANDGKSPEHPWKTLKKASELTYNNGNSLLLKAGDTWNDQLILKDSEGTIEKPFILGSYGTGAKPAIKGNLSTSDVCIVLTDISNAQITGISIANAAMGIQINSTPGRTNHNVTIQQCEFRDIYGVAQWAPSGAFPATQFSAAILIGKSIDGLNIIDCYSYNCQSLTASQNDLEGSRKNINVKGCTIISNRQYGIVISETEGGTIEDCLIYNNGTTDVPVGSTSIMIGNIKNYTIKNNEIGYQQRQGTNPDGCGIDFEINCRDVIVTDNYIHNSAGVGVFFYRHVGGGEYHYNNKITNNLFAYNNRNPNMTSVWGSEVYLWFENSNIGGSITGNKYYNYSPFISFINHADESVTEVANNLPIDYTVEKSWEFFNSGNKEGWTAKDIDDFDVKDDFLSGTIKNSGAYISSPNNLNLDATKNNIIEIFIKNNTSATSAKLKFITETDPTWNEAKEITFTIIPNHEKGASYIIDMSAAAAWTGKITQIRLIPANNADKGTFAIDYINTGNIVSNSQDDENENPDVPGISDKTPSDDFAEENDVNVPDTGDEAGMIVGLCALMLSIAFITIKPFKSKN